MNTTPINVLGLCGSLRTASLNRAVMHTAGALMPDGMRLTVADIRPIPFFDADLFGQSFPPEVSALREQIRSADAVLISTPEYNFSTPGVLKNALDWISRGDDQPFALKPVAIVSASPGPLGGARVQYDLRRVLLFMNALVMAKPEVFIGGAAAKFDAEGHCIDETTKKFLIAQMLALQKWTVMARRMSADS